MVKNTSEHDGGSGATGEQEFQVISTSEEKPDLVISKLSKSDEDLAIYQTVPAWKRKYLARKDANMNTNNDDTSSLSSTTSTRSGNSSRSDPPSPSPRRTALEETLDRCRNIEDTSLSLHDPHDEEEPDEGGNETTSALSSWASFFSLGVVGQSVPSSTSLYSKVLGTTDADTGDKIDSSLNSVSLSSSSDYSASHESAYDYDAVASPAPASQKGKVHRRQKSPSGVMELVESE